MIREIIGIVSDYVKHKRRKRQLKKAMRRMEIRCQEIEDALRQCEQMDKINPGWERKYK
jgi:chromosome segregation ATPase